MGLLSGVKSKLGFGGGEDEWQDNDIYDDGYAQDAYAEGGDYVSGAYDDASYAHENEVGPETSASRGAGDVVSFDTYSPRSFRGVTIDESRPPRVASGGYSNMDGAGGGFGSPSDGSTWSAPSDPSFLNEPKPHVVSGREVLEQIGAASSSGSPSSDPYSQFDSDLRTIHRDPAARIEIVRPKVYADVEKVATAAKAGKKVVLSLDGTKPELASRILDFSFGVASALNKNVDKAAKKVFVISQGNESLSVDEKAYLKKKGVLN